MCFTTPSNNRSQLANPNQSTTTTDLEFHNTYQQLLHNPRIQPTHHPNQSHCLHSTIKAPRSSLRTQFRPSHILEHSISWEGERSKRGRVRISKYLELKVVVHWGLWVEGREFVWRERKKNMFGEELDISKIL